MSEQLIGLSSHEIDQLPFGYIALDSQGKIIKYNRYEAELARLEQDSVLGKNFFTEVAPCTQVKDFEGRFREFADGRKGNTLSFDFVFKFRHGAQNVRIGFIRSPRSEEIIVTVNRLRMEQMALSEAMEFDEASGQLRDSVGNRIVVTGKDFWRSIATAVPAGSGEQWSKVLFRLGLQWGIQHAQRADNLVQRERSATLRETELGTAVELLAQTVSVMGLGSFEADFSHHSAGLIAIRHEGSPFVEFFPEYERGSCPALAGMHAGLFSHLSNQSLAGHEIYCSQSTDERCVFVVGTEARLSRLLGAEDGTADANLLRDLRASGTAS